MAAPLILKLREELGLTLAEAAETLQISVKEYSELEKGTEKHFDKDQLIILWNWMTPKMIDLEHFIKMASHD
ncbi:helix-turn-helix domain-containing protein [Flavobacterium lindanitolerans]|jgi:transcriptional regulator with XRE-family HTH domain|uniref:helix-turn-helix domain-containing protein n=1 Tax=Flavobacterium lindanitolerans TaxID=428988 RepID=UPI0027B9AD60|nr:helix-turn-helix transcriptional regulator [Flavobacterium lindanitolerans]